VSEDIRQAGLSGEGSLFMTFRSTAGAMRLAPVTLVLALAGCGGGSAGQGTQAAGSAAVQIAAAPPPSAVPTSNPTPTPGPAATSTSLVALAAPAGTATPAPLAPLDLSGMWLWNWNGKWMASEWNNANSQIPWRYDHVVRQSNGDIKFRLDAAGSAQLQALNGTPAYSRGLWEVEATLPQLREGMVVAPLWLYDPASKDEIDFEFVGRRGLDVTLHAYPGGVHKQNTVRLFAGTDMSGRRMRFGIRLDETAGTAAMLVDGQVMHSWSKAQLGYFVTKPVKPLIELWAADPRLSWLTAWTGTWTPLAPGDSRTMTVHGYGFTPID
jgi:hypothetical protein